MSFGKRVASARVKLASGEIVRYFYAWRGGPRLVGEPRSPEFVASYMAAIATRREPDGSTLHSVIAGYKASQDFLGLKPRTKADYLKLIPRIEKQFGALPVAALDDARVTRDFLEWRDSMAANPRQADYCWMVLMRLLCAGEGAYAVPAAGPGRAALPRGSVGEDLERAADRRLHGCGLRAVAAGARASARNRTEAGRSADPAVVGLVTRRLRAVLENTPGRAL